MVHSQQQNIRQKKLAVLLRSARLARNRAEQECAEALNVPVATYLAYERGTQPISLPEVEIMAYLFDIPVDYFWGNTALSSQKGASTPEASTFANALGLRRRIIGARLRQARENSEMSIDTLSAMTGIAVADIQTYEALKADIPLPELELLVDALGMSMQQFVDQNGLVGRWMKEQQAIRQFLDLPPDLQEFVSKPVNQPFLELAQRLSEVNVDRLRNVAEGLLEITL